MREKAVKVCEVTLDYLVHSSVVHMAVNVLHCNDTTSSQYCVRVVVVSGVTVVRPR